eukprot:1050131-Rhodomonas_salina.1
MCIRDSRHHLPASRLQLHGPRPQTLGPPRHLRPDLQRRHQPVPPALGRVRHPFGLREGAP